MPSKTTTNKSGYKWWNDQDRLIHPCKYGHLHCARTERGACSNEAYLNTLQPPGAPVCRSLDTGKA